MAEISELITNGGMEYANDLKKMLKYKGSIKSGIDNSLELSVRKELSNKSIPETVMAAVRTIVPPKPDDAQIVKDLVGHSLSEGTDNGYYSTNWRWVIEDDEISDFHVKSVLSESSDDYMIIAHMRLTSAVGKKMDADVKIRYILPRDDDWTIEFVQSQGMKIVKTHLYDDCVYVENGGWLITNKYIVNQCDVSLEVGGKELSCDNWSKFVRVVSPHSNASVFGSEVVIDYVERP